MRLAAYLKGTNDEIMDFLITAVTADTAVTDEQKRVLKVDKILLKRYIEKKLGIELFFDRLDYESDNRSDSKKPVTHPVELINCQYCGALCLNVDNFCQSCSAKLKEVCDCWVKKKPYNCGYDKCPGLQLIVEEIKAMKKSM